MHFWVALFHEQDSNPESLMYPYSYEDENYREYEEEYSKAEAEAMFEKFKKTKEGKNYEGILQSYMQDYNSCYSQSESNGSFGNTNNPNGIYDWFEVGGRVKNIFFPKLTNADLKKLQDEGLIDKKRFVQDLSEYMKLRMMKPLEYAIEREKVISAQGHIYGKQEKYLMDTTQGSLGQTSILIKDLDEKTTLKMWNRYGGSTSKKLSDMFENVICEEGGLQDGKEGFDELFEYWKNKGGVLTVIDCHT